MKQQTSKVVSWWQTVGRAQEQDSRTRMVGRTAFRIIGIILLTLISPVLVTVLVFLAFFAVI